MNTLKVLAIALSLFTAQFATAQVPPPEHISITAKILDIEFDGSFPYGTATVSYEYQCADRFSHVDLKYGFNINRLRVLKVRVVLHKNTMVRCIWPNPQVGIAEFEVDNRSPVKIEAVQPDGQVQPPVKVVEVPRAVSAVLLSRQLREELTKLQQPLRRGRLDISHISSEFTGHLESLVRVRINSIETGPRMSERVIYLGDIHFKLAMPVGARIWQVTNAYFVPSPSLPTRPRTSEE